MKIRNSFVSNSSSASFLIKKENANKEKLEYTVNVENPSKYFNHLVDKALELKQIIKNDVVL